MTQLAELEPTPTRMPHKTESSAAMQYARAFAGLFVRDLHVLRREFFPFAIRVCMNPLLFPTAPLTASPVLYSGSTNFVSTGATGSIQTTFDISLNASSNITIGDSSVLGYGVIGVSAPGVVPIGPVKAVVMFQVLPPSVELASLIVFSAAFGM